MFSSIPERYMHVIRWIFAIGWLILILSLFYDPISAQLTVSGKTFAAVTEQGCYWFQGECRPLIPYPMGARIFWGMIVPLSILILFIFGHETWRRICPLSFISQIPRALGWQRKRVIGEQSWLSRHALYVQFSFLFIGLNVRLLLVNSDRLLLGIFLILTLLLALTVGFLFDGKTWCHYVCPMAPVQMVYSEPGGLLGSAAHTAPTKTLTQSMCRTVDARGQEKSACVACKLSCLDIDAEGAYWESVRQPDRKLLYYAYVGLVVGFYLYFWLYSGNWNFLSAGVWNETNQLTTLLQPGFYIAGHSIPVPKLIAAPLTLIVASGISYAIGLWAERTYKRYNRRRSRPLNAESVQSRAFASATFLAFNLLFFLGVRPTLGYLPLSLQHLVSWLAIVLSSLWLVKTWHRTAQRYVRERDANLLRRQLTKLDIDFAQLLEGRSLDELKPDELYALAKVLPGFTQDYRLQIYKGMLQETLEQGKATASASFAGFQTLRDRLGISNAQHQSVLNQLQEEAPFLFAPAQPEEHNAETTIWRPLQRLLATESTVYRSASYRSASLHSRSVAKGKSSPQQNNQPEHQQKTAQNQRHAAHADLSTVINLPPDFNPVSSNTPNESSPDAEDVNNP